MDLTEIAKSTRHAILTAGYFTHQCSKGCADKTQWIDLGPHNQDPEVWHYIVNNMGRQYWIQNFTDAALSCQEAVFELVLDGCVSFLNADTGLLGDVSENISFMQERILRLYDTPAFWFPICQQFFTKLNSIVDEEIQRSLPEPPVIYNLATGFGRLRDDYAPLTAKVLRPYFIEQLGLLVMKIHPELDEHPEKFMLLRDEGQWDLWSEYGNARNEEDALFEDFLHGHLARKEREAISTALQSTIASQSTNRHSATRL